MTTATGYRRHIEDCTRHDPANFAPFLIDGQPFGWINPENAALIVAASGAFARQAGGVALDPALRDFESRSAALAQAATALTKHYGMKLRKEMYPVLHWWGDTPLAQIDRAAVPWFGVRGFGVHVNGFVRQPDGLHLWIAQRAMDRKVDPGKLDNTIAGGQPIGLSLEENLAKEAWEEAGVDAPLAATARFASTISYKVEKMRGMRNDALFVYDLEFPPDFTPRNTDGEVGGFTLMPMAEAAALVRDTDRFKFNCNLVMIDFLLRHGFFKDEAEELRQAMQPLNARPTGS